MVGFFLKSKINSKLCWIGSNEAGLYLGQKNNLSTGIGYKDVQLTESITLNLQKILSEEGVSY
jgi:hypothetical protein